MGEMTAGLFVEPQPPHDYVQLADGKWYPSETARELVVKRAGEEYARIHSSDEGIGDVNSDEKGSGARYNTGKPPMSYIPFRQQLQVLYKYRKGDHPPLIGLMGLLDEFERHEISMMDIIVDLKAEDLHAAAFVWEYGANKYAAWNWAKGMQWSVPLACISRHIQAVIVDGQELDDESGCSHWGHIVCNLLMLEHYERFYPEGDDRPPASVFKEG